MIKLSTVKLDDVGQANMESWEKKLSVILKGRESEVDDLKATIRMERKYYDVYPSPKNTLRALTSVSFNKTKVIVLGQDPYHTYGMANGLCFSVPSTRTIPPSLVNIYKEIESDLNKKPAEWGIHHAKQGVLLLNTALTVRKGEPGSHDKYWRFLTTALIKSLVESDKPKVFILWGRLAQAAVGRSTDLEEKDLPHLFLKSSHPSPFSCSKFFGNHHFSLCNKFLIQHKRKPIDW